MIRPTMSHALNKDDLHELMSKYASYLEDELAKANERVERLKLYNSDAFIKFAKSHKAVDGKSALFIHSLGVAFNKEQLRKEQE